MAFEKGNKIGNRFKPGETGNENGRPKKLPEVDKLIAEVMGSKDGGIDESGALEIFESLLKQAKKGNTQAAEILLNRAFGKVPNKNEHTGKDGGPLFKTLVIELPPDDGNDEGDSQP